MSSPNDVKPSAPLLKVAQIKALIEKTNESMLDGVINGSQAAHITRGLQERLQVLERAEKKEPLLETMYEDEGRSIEDLELALEMARQRASAQSEEEPPAKFRGRPTALDVLHYHGRVLKELGNSMLRVRDMNETDKASIRKAMRTACWECYIYNRALGRERGRDFVYYDTRDPLRRKLWQRREMPFIVHFDRIFSTFWDIEQLDVPEKPKAPTQAAKPKAAPKAVVKAHQQEKKARQEVQKQEEEINKEQRKRRNERKKRYWEKRGVELHEPVTTEEAMALRDRSVQIVQEHVQQVGPDPSQAQAQVRLS